MNPLVGTFGYLIGHTLRNRFAAMAKRLRRPRYLIGFVVGVAYFGFFLWGGSTARSGRTSVFQSDSVRAIAPLMLLLVLSTSWFAGSALSALNFTQAETTMLFTAPVTRRALILYKLAGAQVPVVINALIFAFIFGRGPAAIPKWLAAVSLWVTFSTINLHRLGAALVRSSTFEHGMAGMKRHWFSQLVGIVIVVVITLSIVSGTAHGIRPDAANPLAFIDQFATILSAPAARAVLYPFAVIVAPAFTRSLGAWAAAMGPALAMLALHLIWVLRSQSAFEEAAMEVAAVRQQRLASIRRRGMSGATPLPAKSERTFAIASTGNPAIAIVWKNLLCLMRTFRPMQFLSSLIMPVTVAVVFGGRAHDLPLVIAGVAGLIGLMLFMTGGMVVRNDLRADLLNLSLLKTLPLRGREIMLAEVASAALPLSLVQYLCLTTAVIALQFSGHPLAARLAIALAITMPLGLLALNACIGTLQNGVAVLFPGWVRLGVEGSNPGAFDVIGQALLSMIGMLIAFAICLIVPAIVAFVVFTMVKPPQFIAVPFVIVVGAAAVAGESYAMMVGLGRTLERVEPQQIG